jgi:hypothetical protein
MKLEDLRLIEARSFGLGKTYGGELDYHGKVGFFKLFTPQSPSWSQEENLRLLTILTDAAEKVSNSLRRLGFKRQIHNVAIVGQRGLGPNKLVARTGVAGKASRQGHGIVVNKEHLTPSYTPAILAHEWGHKYWFNLTKDEQAKVEELYDSLVVGPFVEEDTWKNIERILYASWQVSLQAHIEDELGINDRWIDHKTEPNEDPKITYLRGIKSGGMVSGVVIKTIPHVMVFGKDERRRKETNIEPGDEVDVKLERGMWEVVKSKFLGKVYSRMLSSKGVNDHIDLKPSGKSWDAIEDIRKEGNIALVKKLPKDNWKAIAQDAITNIMRLVPAGEFSSALEDRAESLLQGGLDATLEAWWKKVQPSKGKTPKDLRAVFLMLKKTLKERLEIEPFHEYQKANTKKRMGTKSGNVRRQKLQKQGSIHSAYGASNPSEFWATMVEYGALGKPLDPRVAKLLKTLGR